MEILRRNLDSQQLAIAQEAERSLLVLAPPGSGKTRLLTNAAAYRLRAAPRAWFRVCCLTFGVEAARELRARLADPALRVPSGRYWVGNFHQLGAFLLARWGHLIGWPRDAGILVPPDNLDLIAGVLASLNIRRVNPSNASMAISHLKGRRPVQSDVPAETLKAIRARYDSELARRHLRDFDDLILHTLELLRQHPQARQSFRDAYPYVFVDELQDTNLLQLDLIAEIVGDQGIVFGVADDDQMIYAWRDARPENIAEFQERFRAEIRVLTGNYRCPPRVVSVANAIISANDRSREDLMESRREDIRGEVQLGGALGEEAEAETVAGVIDSELATATPPGEIAVLAPVKFLFPPVRSALDNRGIRYVAIGFDELIGVPAVRVLRGCLAATSGGLILPEEVELSCELAGEHWIDLEQAESAVVLGRRSSPRNLLGDLVSALGLGSLRAPARDGAGIRQLARMMRQAIAENEPSTTSELARAVLMEWGRLEAAALQAERAVKIMTSFLAKGTEYDVVILPFLNDGRVPYAPRGQQIDWDESRRVFYVSITRAKRRVLLIRDLSRADSLLLEGLPEGLCQPLATG